MGLIPNDLAQRIARDFNGKVLNGYTVGELCGVGATGVVLSASKKDERAAIKICRKDLFDNESELKRIERQVEKSDHSHPNIVRTHGTGFCPELGYHYLIMDFVDDPTLTEIVCELSMEQVRSIIQQTATAAFFMHETMEQVHRDIKPDNVAVNRTNNHVTLLDLGLVRPVIGPTATDLESIHIRGTKQYAPPELLGNTVELNEQGWLAVTFYQLGATLYEMLTKSPPFDGLSGDELLDAIRSVPLKIESPDVPPDLAKLALDCLSKDPSQRLSVVSWNRLLDTERRMTERRMTERDEELEEYDDLLAKLSMSHVPEPSVSPTAQEEQLRKSVRAEVSRSVESAIRAFLLGNDRRFPGYTITRREDLETDHNSVHVIEMDFASRGVPLNVYTVVATEITDPRSRACVCTLQTLTQAPASPLNLESFRPAYQGAFVLAECSTQLKNEVISDLTSLLRQTNE